MIFAFAPPHCSAQTTNQLLDTIYANDTKNVALFFPEPIRQGVTGADNFIFTYNREKEQYFGLLQAKPGKESNLLVVNRNGSVFSYIIRYKAQLSKLNYFIPVSSSIGNEKTKIDLPILPEEEQQLNNANYYLRACRYLLNNKQPIRTLQKRNYGVVLSVKNIVFDKEELYFVIQIDNKSALDYDLNFLNLSTETRQKGKRKSLQRVYHSLLYKHNMPSKIRENETARFVYVLPKFSLSNDHRVILQLNEDNGERNIELNISHRFINQPY
tara:strand:- start:15614 stop:16423 length:810 start_codon:yes stop_codon:yes gene_type:complete